MNHLALFLACTTLCHTPIFKVGDCTNDREDKVNPTYRKIMNVGLDDYTYMIANREEDIGRHLFDGGDIETFDERNIKVVCPKWLE